MDSRLIRKTLGMYDTIMTDQELTDEAPGCVLLSEVIMLWYSSMHLPVYMQINHQV